MRLALARIHEAEGYDFLSGHCGSPLNKVKLREQVEEADKRCSVQDELDCFVHVYSPP